MLADELTRQQQARELELELIRVRAGAEAARLEARAAELELMLRRMARGEDQSRSPIAMPFAAASASMAATGIATPAISNASMASHSPAASIADHPLAEASALEAYRSVMTMHSGASFGAPHFTNLEGLSGGQASDNWDQRLHRLRSRENINIAPTSALASEEIRGANHLHSPNSSPVAVPPLWTPKVNTDFLQPDNFSLSNTGADACHVAPARELEAPQVASQTTAISDHEVDRSLFDTIIPNGFNANVSPVDVATAVAKPIAQAANEEARATHSMPVTSTSVASMPGPVTSPAPSVPARVESSSAKASTGAVSSLAISNLAVPNLAKKPVLVAIPEMQLAGDDEQDESVGRRFRPASWMVSTLAHCGVLILLGFMTLTTTKPKDQMAFSSSASESTEQTMETFEIESSEPIEPSEPVTSETAYEISDMGTMAVTEVSMDIPPAPPTFNASELTSSSVSSLSSSSMKSLKGETMATSQFCGVDGGGNHFVYLVDSSGSMGAGFQSARSELLNSIDQLKPDQRFYVVFFDEEPDYMRLMNPNENDTASVMATPENKKRLRKWAMTVEMNKGKAPYQVLPFALSLRPDVIFLLSDGEFPSAIEEILREQNRQENLFGESGPISIVHTIRYHGREGQEGQNAEATMVKIAKENGGQYRHVPKPSQRNPR